MATLEYYKQQLKEAKDELDNANAALKSFQESKDRGGKLDELRDKELQEDLNTKEQAALSRLADEETELKKRVNLCTEVWAKWNEEVLKREKDAQTGNDFGTRWGQSSVYTPLPKI
ncbi:9823_t:CDS:1 [Paraglomus occultum]|uniref:9823_t:CDS:1 n=1 Tax=Paraglomus occultum TaxID=144539 RepID=A0A9N9GV46_9GLOM|nr:9823_t:CDS:1 [Paraglomus occultum]